MVGQNGRFGRYTERTGGGDGAGRTGASGFARCGGLYLNRKRFALRQGGWVDEAGIRSHAEFFIVALRGFLNLGLNRLFGIRVIPQQTAV